MRYLAILLALCAVGCGANEDPKEPDENPTIDLVMKSRLYRQWNDAATLKNGGWVDRSWDSTLFSGLRGCYADVPLENGQLSPGEWTRRDIAWGGDWSEHTKSQISRDMLLGVAWWAWCGDRKGVAADVVAYAKANDMIMGPGDPFRTRMSKGLLDTFKLIAGQIDKAPGVIVTGAEEGYARHLAGLHILLRSYISDGVSKLQKAWVSAAVKREGHNPFYLFLDARFNNGDFQRVEDQMMNQEFWPADRLPTSDDYCDHWIMQRDKADGDWQPCPDRGEEYTASDWLFVYHLLKR